MEFHPRDCLCFECPLADCRTPCPFGMDTSRGRENIDQYLFGIESKREKRKEKEKEYQANYYQKNKEKLKEYNQKYILNTDNLNAVKEQAKYDVGLHKFLKAERIQA